MGNNKFDDVRGNTRWLVLSSFPYNSHWHLNDINHTKCNKFKAKLDLEVNIERAHRVERHKHGKKRSNTNENQPHTIVCRLRDWKQREQVLRKARKEKPVGLHISEDVTLSTLLKRQAHLEKFKAAKQAGKIAYFVLDRLEIRDKPPSY